MDGSKNQFDAKVNAIKDQKRNAGNRRKAKLGKRIDTLTGEYNARTVKLKQAVKWLAGLLKSEKRKTLR
ncbi:MAG: hypothetical protein HC867_01825 [Bacteroidia bacterium]|nr:hypothetical protein [Bacteroidia bacterium]